MLVLLGVGSVAAEELSSLLAAAGFRLTDVISTGSPFNIVERVPI